MPVEDAGVAHNLVRRAKTVRGEVRFRMRCEPRFDYARATHTVERRSDTEVTLRRPRRRGRAGAAAAVVGADAHRGRRRRGRVHAAAPTSRRGSSSRWCCTDEPSPSASARLRERRVQADRELLAPLDRRSTYKGRWREMVNRSALTLKLLTSRQHGSIVAAPTFGLPETDRRRAQLGLPLHLDPRLVLHPLRAHAARLHGRGRGVHALGDGALRGARAGRLAPDHVRHRRPPRAARGDAAAPRGLHGLAAGPHRQRRLHAPPARHLRRADGLGVPVRQVRLAHPARCAG